MPKPHIVLVPGAWQLPSAYSTLSDALKSLGYPVTTIPLTAVFTSGGQPSPNADGDVNATRAAIMAAADAGEDVAVVMHSYGGIPGAEAAHELGKEARAKEGKKGGVVRLVYLTAFANPEGVALLDLLGGQWLPWWKAEAGGIATLDEDNIFYNDTPPNVLAEAKGELQLFSEGAFLHKAKYATWKDIPSSYIVCTKDHAIPPENQEGMASQEGGKWVDVIKIDGDHFPWLKDPKGTADAVSKAIGA